MKKAVLFILMAIVLSSCQEKSLLNVVRKGKPVEAYYLDSYSDCTNEDAKVVAWKVIAKDEYLLGKNALDFLSIQRNLSQSVMAFKEDVVSYNAYFPTFGVKFKYGRNEVIAFLELNSGNDEIVLYSLKDNSSETLICSEKRMVEVVFVYLFRNVEGVIERF